VLVLLVLFVVVEPLERVRALSLRGPVSGDAGEAAANTFVYLRCRGKEVSMFPPETEAAELQRPRGIRCTNEYV